MLQNLHACYNVSTCVLELMQNMRKNASFTVDCVAKPCQASLPKVGSPTSRCKNISLLCSVVKHTCHCLSRQGRHFACFQHFMFLCLRAAQREKTIGNRQCYKICSSLQQCLIVFKCPALCSLSDSSLWRAKGLGFLGYGSLFLITTCSTAVV